MARSSELSQWMDPHPPDTNKHPALSLCPCTVIGPSHQTGFIRRTPGTANPLPSHTGGERFCGAWRPPHWTKHLEETSKPSSSVSQTKDSYICECMCVICPPSLHPSVMAEQDRRFFCQQVIWKQKSTSTASKNIRHQWKKNSGHSPNLPFGRGAPSDKQEHSLSPAGTLLCIH